MPLLPDNMGLLQNNMVLLRNKGMLLYEGCQFAHADMRTSVSIDTLKKVYS